MPRSDPSVLLLLAAREGDAQRVRAALRAGACPRHTECGRTGLSYAAARGHVDVVAAYIEARVDLQYHVSDWSPLMEAVQRGRLAVVRALLDAGVPASDRAWDTHKTVLHVAAARGDVDVVRALLHHGGSGDTTATCARGHTPLHDALTIRARIDIISALASRGADVNAPWPACGSRPLYRACEWGRVDLVQCLLACGARVHDVDARTGNTPAHLVAGRGDERLLRVLLRGGAPLDARDAGGGTPLHAALSAGHATCAQLLIHAAERAGCVAARIHDTVSARGEAEEGAAADDDAPARERTAAVRRRCGYVVGDTPLHVAARAGCITMVRALVNAGAETGTRNADDATPLRVALDARQLTCARVLEHVLGARHDDTQRAECEELASLVIETPWGDVFNLD